MQHIHKPFKAIHAEAYGIPGGVLTQESNLNDFICGFCFFAVQVLYLGYMRYQKPDA